jgi:hypothetical protein
MRSPFPKVLLPSELPNTAFVFLNLTSSPPNLNFYFMAAAGTGFLTAADVIEPGGQLAKLGSESFYNAVADGWRTSLRTSTEYRPSG